MEDLRKAHRDRLAGGSTDIPRDLGLVRVRVLHECEKTDEEWFNEVVEGEKRTM